MQRRTRSWKRNAVAAGHPSNDAVNVSSGLGGHEMATHSQLGHQNQRPGQVVEGANYFDLSSRLLQVPCGKRSRRAVREKVTDQDVVDCVEKTVKGNPSQPHLVAHSSKRRSRKCKRKPDPDDSEIICPRPFRCRGQLRNYNKKIWGQEKKLDSQKFEVYLENIWRGFSEEQTSEFTCLDSLWFALYTKEPMRAKVLNWIKRKDIFSKKYIFVPIVKWDHWSLLIFCHFGQSLGSETMKSCMLLLDSMQMADPKRLEPEIRRFVLDIYEKGELKEKKKLINKIPLLVPKVPQQRNGDECGYFVLYYIKLFVQSAPDSFSLSEGYPYFMKKDWFTPEGLQCFSERLDSSTKSSSSSDE